MMRAMLGVRRIIMGVSLLGAFTSAWFQLGFVAGAVCLAIFWTLLALELDALEYHEQDK